MERITPFRSALGLFVNLKRLMSVSGAPQSLKERATQSGVWIGGGFIVQRGLQFGSNLILTRLLFPEAFGLMALCTVFLIGLAMFSDLGLKPAIIRDARGNDPVFLNTAWTIQVIRGMVLCAAGCLLAYPISLLYGQPILMPLLMVLSTTAAITGFSSIKMATAERDLDFRTVTFIQIAGQAITIVTMVATAIYWKSVWALAIGNITGSLATLIIGYWLLRGHQHRFQIETAAARSLVHFGKWIFLATIVTFLGGEGLRAIQATFVTPAEFGILAIAYTIAAIPIELSTKLTASIGLPALAEAHRRDPGELKIVLRKFRVRMLALALSLIGLVATAGEPLVILLYDPRYHAAGILMVLLTLSGAVGLIFAGYNNALLVLGDTKSYLTIMFFVTVSRIVCTVTGFNLSGTTGMIVGIGAANFLTIIASQVIATRVGVCDLKLDIIAISIIFCLIYFTYII